jgi:hypothetical protein
MQTVGFGKHMFVRILHKILHEAEAGLSADDVCRLSGALPIGAMVVSSCAYAGASTSSRCRSPRMPYFTIHSTV